MLKHDSAIIIVGGGVFGLSTALWLARGGYRNITVFDRCAFDENHYDPSKGCDGASADINKVFRMAYADKIDYQDLAIEARDHWLSWNKSIEEADPAILPAGLTPEDKLFYICGSYFLSEGSAMHKYYSDSLEKMEQTAPEFRKMQFVKGNAADEKRLGEIDPKWVEKYHIIDKINDNETSGFIDIQGGITIADKACVFAKHLCEKAGVKFILGDPKGKLSSLIIENEGVNKKVAGIKTCDGLRHFGDLVVVAAGSWTASIIPEAHRAVEATAGTVMFIDIPEHRKDLRQRFHPDNYPVWSYRKGEGDECGIPIARARKAQADRINSYYQGGSFPISKEGRLKFGFRGRKFTNFQNHPTEPNLRISTPRTKYTLERINTVPLYGLQRMKKVIAQAFPELTEFGFTDSRLCWYTDSIDNDYVIDYVPGFSNSLFICTGGSGHAFKFLPVLGKHVKNQIEQQPDQFTTAWKWRVTKDGASNNGLEEGETGPRNLASVQMASPRDFKLDKIMPEEKL